jgi:hypothetical protein
LSFFSLTFEFRPASQAKPPSKQMQPMNQGANSMKPKGLTKRDAAITTHEQNVRARAHELDELRGRIDGHAEEDWLQAEGEVAATTEKPC